MYTLDKHKTIQTQEKKLRFLPEARYLDANASVATSKLSTVFRGRKSAEISLTGVDDL
jgi:hypothetical protein